MRTRLREETEDGLCPYCGLITSHMDNEVTVLNTLTGDSLVECGCGERYFCIVVPDDV